MNPRFSRAKWPASSDEYHLVEQILRRKEALGRDLLILTHHYQRREIVALGDWRGDSLELARKSAADREARFIVFCGVHFMAESAAILSQPHQTVQIPDVKAGCLMSDMADPESVAGAWEELTGVLGEETVLPLVYINSEAALKAFCGRLGGATCTSANALAALRWGFSQREKIFFLPDQHLGRNMGNRLGIPPEEMIVWDADEPLGGHRPEEIRRARLILWDGYCHVHTRFQVEHVLKMREAFPGARVVVHPECTQEVVNLADACGSTGFIVEYVQQAPPGATIIVGTEINLVQRLALENPDKQVLELHYSLCPSMFRINLEKLLWTLENLGQINVVTVAEPTKSQARLALERMMAFV